MDLTVPFTAEDLPDVLRQIAEDELTGELVAEGSRGTKSILISPGQMSVTSEGGQKLRLGDILLVRGKITSEELAEALTLQGERGGSRLGDVLCELGYVTRGEIDEVVQFQLEEEFCDLFNWDDATFAFGEGEPPPVEGSATTSLSIDPNQIIVEATRRVNTWNQIKKRIPSMNVVYQLTPRGERMLSSATRGGRRLLEFVASGETVEGIVRKSYLGRFVACRSLMQLLDARSIEPVPDDELLELAEFLEEGGRYEQAKGIYARLYEIEEDPSAREAISEHVAELESVAEEAGPEVAPGDEFAVERAPAVGWITAGLFIAFMFLALFAIGSIPRVKAFWFRTPPPGAFVEAEVRALALEGQGEFPAAADAYLSFIDGHSRSVFASEARRRARELFERYEALAGPLIARAEGLAAKERQSEAIQAFRRVLRDFPRTARRQEILHRIEGLSRARSDRLRSLAPEKVKALFAGAKDALESKDFTRARLRFTEVTEAREALPAEVLEAHRILGQLSDREKKLLRLVTEAERAAEGGEDEAAAEKLSRIVKEWPRSSPGLLASELLDALQREKLRAHAELARAKGLLAERERLFSEGKVAEAKTKEAEALPVLIRAARNRLVTEGKEARALLEGLISGQRELSSLLDRARKAKAEGKLDEAFNITYDLARKPECGAVLGQLVLEYELRSVPERAMVAIGERDVGSTSRERPFQLRLRPMKKALVKLSAVGFDDLRFIVDPSKNRERVIKRRLNKRVLARCKLESPARLAKSPSGKTIFALAGKTLVAMHAGGTSERWRFDLPGKPGEPVVAGDRVSVLVGKKVFSFRASQKLPEPAELPGPCVAPPMVAELKRLAGFLLAYASPAGTEVIYAIELRGKKKWTAGLAGKLMRPPLWGDDRLYLASTKALTCIDGATGEKVWHEKLASEPVDGPIFCGDAVAVCLSGGEVVARTRAEGKSLLSSPLGAVTIIGGDDAVFAAGGGKLSRVDLADGKTAWSRALEPAEPVYGTYSEGRVYVGGSDGLLQSIDAGTHELEWQTKLEGAISPYPVVVGDNIHFVREGEEFCVIKLIARK